AVAEFRRDDELALAADLHPGDALVPALDDLAGAEVELERLAAVEAAVELLAVLERGGVVHRHAVALLGLGPGAFLEGLVLQAAVGLDHLALLLLLLRAQRQSEGEQGDQSQPERLPHLRVLSEKRPTVRAIPFGLVYDFAAAPPTPADRIALDLWSAVAR